MLAFEDIARTGQAVRSEVGCQQPVGSRLGCVQLLGIGRVAQECPEAGGLGARAAQQVDKGLLVELHQFADGHGSGEGADRRRGMEDAIVRAPQKLTDSDACFIAGDSRKQ
ncbi:hypothetical protein D3C77_496250 [compost metagenome]